MNKATDLKEKKIKSRKWVIATTKEDLRSWTMRGGKGMHLRATAIEREFKGFGEWSVAIARRNRCRDIFKMCFR